MYLYENVWLLLVFQLGVSVCSTRSCSSLSKSFEKRSSLLQMLIAVMKPRQVGQSLWSETCWTDEARSSFLLLSLLSSLLSPEPCAVLLITVHLSFLPFLQLCSALPWVLCVLLSLIHQLVDSWIS